MIDREQEQARLLAESVGANGRAGRDLAWIVTVGVLLLSAVAVAGLPEGVTERVDALDRRETQVLALLAVILTVGSVLFAIRRYRDTVRIRRALEQLAERDSLTGLPNRRFLGDGLDDLLTATRQSGGRLAALFIELRGFKKTNETYGHEVGDQLMVAAADRLVEAVGGDDVVVRYGGNEFLAFAPGTTSVLAAERLAKRLIRAIEIPFERGDEVLRLSANVGVALAEEGCSEPEDVLQDADAAVHQAKLRGPGTYALFDRSMRDVLTPSTAERRLREALEDGEFRVLYDPIVSLWTRRLVGVDALLCWEDPGRGLVHPSEFATALEDSGLIVPVGSWMLGQVCRQSRRWQDLYPDRPPVNVKVPISDRQLAQTDFISTLRHSLDSSGADADRICLEVTETPSTHDVNATWGTLREAKALGVTLALGGFGTGRSSLAYLRRFSLDLLRIDPDFIAGLATSREDKVLTEHTIGMAKALGIVTVAEGVGSDAQVEILRSMNCDLAQGPFFSDPQPPEVIEEILARTGPEDEWKPVPRSDPRGQPAPQPVDTHQERPR